MDNRDRIELRSRYSDVYVYLVKVSDNLYKMETNSLYVSSSFVRLNNLEIDYSADPEGGPYIAVGGEINGLYITHIWNDENGIYFYSDKNKLTHDEFVKDVKENIEKMQKEYPMLRKGQCAFNYLFTKYPVQTDAVKNEDGIDCYYDDRQFDDFVGNVYHRYILEWKEN